MCNNTHYTASKQQYNKQQISVNTSYYQGLVPVVATLYVVCDKVWHTETRLLPEYKYNASV